MAEVDTGSRLHFGFYRTTGGPFLFASIGVAIKDPSFKALVRPCEGLEVFGQDRDRVSPLVEEVIKALGVPGARVEVLSSIPAHVGLGSTTQIKLGIAYALNALYGLGKSIRELAFSAGRGEFSGIGMLAFEVGGLIVDTGRRAELKGPLDLPKALVRLDVPGDWRFLLLIREGMRGLSEEAERDLLLGLEPMPDGMRGRICSLLLDALLPAVLWGHARVGIVAIEPGPNGNVKALTINTVEGPLEFLADVLNDAPTTGGTIKRVSIVAPQDYNRLRDSLVQRLQQEAYSRLVEQLDEGEFIPSESVKVEITDEEFAQRIGDQAEILRGRMLLKVGGLAADGSSANLLLRQLMERNIPDGYCLRDETLRFRDVGTVQVGSGVVRFTRVGSGEAMSCADEDALIAALRGKSLKAAGVYLMQHLDLEEPPVISAIPAVYGRIPLLSQRIAIRIVPRSD